MLANINTYQLSILPYGEWEGSHVPMSIIETAQI